MSPQEEAKELVDAFTLVGLQQRNEGIQCALMCVDEIIKAIQYLEPNIVLVSLLEYWQEVKHEIEKYE